MKNLRVFRRSKNFICFDGGCPDCQSWINFSKDGDNLIVDKAYCCPKCKELVMSPKNIAQFLDWLI